jgi:hypothetical protein
MATARIYPRFFSSATSTQMALAAFLHANDFEMDAAQGLSKPTNNNPSLLKILETFGYNTYFLCASGFSRKKMLTLFTKSIPKIWNTNDFGEMLGKFETLVEKFPFAIYVWCNLPHISANLALAPYARHVDELIAGGCAITDNLLGAILEIIRLKSLSSDTTVIVYGDHGDDYWTHGFKNGMLHGVEPFTPLVHTPLIIQDARLFSGRDDRLISTIDLAPTCLDLLGLPWTYHFPSSGKSILESKKRDIAFSQNLTANQTNIFRSWPKKCFSSNNHSYTLLVISEGLELYNFRIDPSNHFNILNFFNIRPDYRLEMVAPPYAAHAHFNTIYHMWRGGSLQDTFRTLHEALRNHVAAKSGYVRERARGRLELIDQAAFGRINRAGWVEFFRVPRWAGPRPGGAYPCQADAQGGCRGTHTSHNS